MLRRHQRTAFRSSPRELNVSDREEEAISSAVCGLIEPSVSKLKMNSPGTSSIVIASLNSVCISVPVSYTHLTLPTIYSV